MEVYPFLLDQWRANEAILVERYTTDTGITTGRVDGSIYID
jgi:hypothetical protein